MKHIKLVPISYQLIKARAVFKAASTFSTGYSFIALQTYVPQHINILLKSNIFLQASLHGL